MKARAAAARVAAAWAAAVTVAARVVARASEGGSRRLARLP